MRRFDESCNICGSTAFRTIATRSDGIPVLACETCGHGVVAYFPYDAEQLYGNTYFAAGANSECGYSDYEYTGEHGLAWAAALVHLLQPAGRVLDIGCANGQLLRKLGDGYERFGIEPSPQAASEAKAAGIPIIASNILDPRLNPAYAGSFDTGVAVAVLEHIDDFKGAAQAALALLKPEGLLLFEVPLITEDGPDTWFRSSLEHIHYPCEQSLRYLFEKVLGLELAGSKLDIKDFAYTYIGVTSKSSEVVGRVAANLDRWLTAAPAELNPEEGRFRWLLEVLHAGQTSPEVLALYRHLATGDFNAMSIRRISELWAADLARRKGFEQYVKEVEGARDWWTAEFNKRTGAIEELDRYLKEVEGARDWWVEESRKRDAIIEEMRKAAEVPIAEPPASE